MDGTWKCALIRVDFSQECAGEGPLIRTAHTPFKNFRIDQV
jgi:hypothetical protein